MNFHWSRGTRSLKWNQFTSSFNDNNLGNWKFIIQIPGNSNCQSGSLEWTSFTLKRKQLNATNGSQCEPGFLQQSSCFTFVQTRITACSAKPTTEREREMWDTCSGKKKPPSPPLSLAHRSRCRLHPYSIRASTPGRIKSRTRSVSMKLKNELCWTSTGQHADTLTRPIPIILKGDSPLLRALNE